MKFYDFQQYYSNQKLIGINQLKPSGVELDKRRLTEWQKAEKIERISNNWYWFAQNEPTLSDLFTIANRIYGPSYISFETALSYYSIIPEQVFTFQSVCTRKTKKMEWRGHPFIWHHIQPRFFLDYVLISDGNTFIKMASPEKALIDLFYFRHDVQTLVDLVSLRLNPDFMKNQFKWDVSQQIVDWFNYKRLTFLFNELKEEFYYA